MLGGAEQVPQPGQVSRARHAGTGVRAIRFHQSADRHDVSVAHTDQRIGFGHGAGRERQDVVAKRAEVDVFALLDDRRHRRVHVQDDVAAVVDLGRHVQRHPREERLHRDGRRDHSGAVDGGGRRNIGGDTGDEEIVGADLQHRLLVVQCRDARRRQNLHLALGLQEFHQRGEAAGLEGQAEQRRDSSGRLHHLHAWIHAQERVDQHAARLKHRTRCRQAKGAARAGSSVKGGPIHAALAGVRQRDLDDLGLEHHFALDIDLHRPEIVFDLTQFGRHRAHHDHA